MQNVHQPGPSGNAEVSPPARGKESGAAEEDTPNPLAKRLENGYKALPVEGNVAR